MPRSSQKKSRKKLNLCRTLDKGRTVLNKNVIFDELEEEISPEAMEFIDIATNKEVIINHLQNDFCIILQQFSLLFGKENILLQTLLYYYGWKQ